MTGQTTIFALASGAGRAGVAVVRISGPEAGRALTALSAKPLPRPRLATLRRLSDAGGALIDEALALWFPAPHSFTGEDVAELQIHGGPAVIEALAASLLALGLRPAEPGAFTRRAFENGKLDLTRAEALADLVDAETEGQRRQALSQLGGDLQRLYDAWRDQLVSALALLEADIDFPDEDLPDAVGARARPIIETLAAALGAHLADQGRGERVRDGYRIAILGPPNAGKSSLLNALARREAAIVSDVPGTTRDVVEVRLTLAGFPVWIADTAGLREARDAIESEGVRRALARAEDADLRIGVLPMGALPEPRLEAALRPDDMRVRSKADLYPQGLPPAGELAVSAISGAGIPGLEAALAARVSTALSAREQPALTRARHRLAVQEAETALRRALNAPAVELAAEDVRLAARALGRLTGRIDVEDVLDEIFSSFCIGK